MWFQKNSALIHHKNEQVGVISIKFRKEIMTQGTLEISLQSVTLNDSSSHTVKCVFKTNSETVKHESPPVQGNGTFRWDNYTTTLNINQKIDLSDAFIDIIDASQDNTSDQHEHHKHHTPDQHEHHEHHKHHHHDLTKLIGFARLPVDNVRETYSSPLDIISEHHVIGHINIVAKYHEIPSQKSPPVSPKGENKEDKTPAPAEHSPSHGH